MKKHIIVIIVILVMITLFSFLGSSKEKYMDENDEGIRYDQPALFYQMISALDNVVPNKYQIARNKINKINFGRKNPNLDPNTGERW